MDKKEIRRSELMVHISTVMLGMAGLFGKLVNLPSLALTLGRVGFSSITLLVFLLARKEPLKLKSRSHYLRFVLSGVLLAFHWTTFYHSIQVSSVAIGLMSSATTPVFTMFLEPIFFKEKFRLRNLVYAFMALTGIIMISHVSAENANLEGVIWGVIAGASYAVLTMLNRSHMKLGYPSAMITFYEQSTAAIVLLPICLITVKAVPTMRDIGLLIVLGAVFTALAHSVFIGGLKNVSACKAGLISCMEPVYGSLFAFILLGEALTVSEIIGGALILAVSVFQSIPWANET